LSVIGFLLSVGRRRARRRPTGPSLLVVLLLLLVARPVAGQGEGRRAGLVVVHGDGRVVTRCVGFSEEQISGMVLLQRSGLAVAAATGPMGSTVCALNGEGCAATDCWCECKGTPCTYWTYFLQGPDGGWAYGNIGAAMRQVGNGDLDGWVWGDGATMPPAVSFETVCGGEAESPAPRPTLTMPPTLTPELSLTPSPSERATPSSTRQPVAGVEGGEVEGPEITPTSTPSQAAEVVVATVTRTPLSPTATSTAVVDQSEEPVAEEAVPPEVSLPSDEDLTPGREPTGYLGFLAILGVIGGAFALLRRK
jgi:hypothetical protein